MCASKNPPEESPPRPAADEAAAASAIMTKLKSVYISVFIDVLGIGLVIPVLPYLILSFDNTGAAEVGLTIAAFSLCQIPGSIIFGAISDKYGRRPVLLLSIFSSAVSFLLCAFARDLPFIIAARCVSGLTGGSISVAQAYVADVTTVDERPRFLGLIGATIGIAFTFGPGIGAGVAAAMDAAGASIQQQYSGVFFLAAGFSFLGFAFACRNLEESSGAGGAEPAAVEVASGAAPAPARRSAVAVPILLVALAMFASNYAFTVMQSTYGVLIFEEWGWSTGALGLILVLSGLEIAVLQGKLIKGLVDATGKHGASFLACLCLGGGLALLPYTLFSKPLHFFSFALHVAGFSIGQTALPALLSRFASKEDQGKSLGLGQAFQAAARVAAPVASGFLYDNSKDIVGSEYAAPYIVGGAICVAAGLPLLCMLSKSRAEKEGAGSGSKVEEEEGGGAGEGGQGGAIVEAEMVEVNL
ncbi:hypothetical protein TeGR_g12971 [Tetraparma gracilis]|uniref:Major facilitator superfamily (MFS) profile domain-containing protein n=1 Tax=Tetraparma gracilis TaxID=2962635 RepID=A0ABQ6MK06_9STRA|nr:hypothetical protein TeGR_g12971 [Tetraparma gracilis]